VLYGNLAGLENLEYFTSHAGGAHTQAELRGCLEEAGLARTRRAPKSGLDPRASSEFPELLKKPAGSGAAIPMATHNLFR